MGDMCVWLESQNVVSVVFLIFVDIILRINKKGDVVFIALSGLFYCHNNFKREGVIN